MKLLAAALFALWPAALLAQLPAPPSRHHSLSLEAQSVANGGAATASGDANRHDGAIATTDGGRVNGSVVNLRDQHVSSNRTNLKVTVRNLATTPDSLTLEWYFVAVGVGTTTRQVGTKDFIFDQGSQAVQLAPGVTNAYPVSSKEVMNSTTRSSTTVQSNDPNTDLTFNGGLRAVGTTTREGMNMRGWFVRLTDGGKVLAVRGSSDTYEDLAKDNAKIKAMDVLSVVPARNLEQ